MVLEENLAGKRGRKKKDLNKLVFTDNETQIL
jgi:hypothetical protein